MPQIADWELEQSWSWLLRRLETPARQSEEFNAVLAQLIADIEQAKHNLNIAEQEFLLRQAKDAKAKAKQRLAELRGES